jgi:hypothetical protein
MKTTLPFLFTHQPYFEMKYNAIYFIERLLNIIILTKIFFLIFYIFVYYIPQSSFNKLLAKRRGEAVGVAISLIAIV